LNGCKKGTSCSVNEFRLTTIAPAIKGWIQDFVSSNIRFELGCHGTPSAGPVAKTASFRFPLKDDASKHR
jgi:hypothetical protein